MPAFEEGSPCKIALELIEQSYEQLELGTNEGDQAFHLLMEAFESSMEAKLATDNVFDVNHVAICLTSAYRRAIDRVEESATEEIKVHLRTVAIRLCEVNSSLLRELSGGGASGRLLAECVRTGDVRSRVRL